MGKERQGTQREQNGKLMIEKSGKEMQTSE
jgi:hypothetical protein